MKSSVRKITSLLYKFLIGVSLVVPLFLSIDCTSNPMLTISKLSKGEEVKIRNRVKSVNDTIKSLDIGITDFLIWSKDESSDKKELIFNLTMDMASYSMLEQDNKKVVLNTALVEIENSKISAINRSKIYNFICNNDKATSSLVRQLSDDVTADFASAYSSFKPFTGVVGWVLGVFTLTIFVILGFTVTMDLAYIVVPAIQCALSKDNSNVKPKFVSLEAWNAVKKAEEGNTFREPLGIYCKLKVKQFMALGICLLYLISGKIYTLIAWFMDMFSGVLPN